jgi:type I restriction enzyme S subunit
MIPCSEKKLNVQEVLECQEKKVNHFETMNPITNEKELQDLWENLHHLLWSNEGFTPEKAMDHLNLIFYIRLLEPRIEDGSIDLPDICKFSSLTKIHDENMLFERFKREVLPALYRYSPKYFSQFRIRKPDNLYKLIGHINRIDLEINDRDFLGHIYEYIIGRGTSSMSDDGQYFTNRLICQYSMELVNPSLDKGNIRSMIDPFCGTGGFIIQYVKYISADEKIDWASQKEKIFGVDIKIGSVMTTLINLMFITGYSFDTDNIIHKNSFYDELFNGKKFHYIFTNPPFGGDKDKGEQFRFKYAKYSSDVSEKTGRAIKGKRLGTLVSSTIESIKIEINDKVDCAVMLCMGLLEIGGTACVVLPEGFFFGRSKKRVALRKKLVENFNVQYVVSIPQDAFDNTSTKTSMLIFKNEKKTSKIKFIDFTKRDDVKEKVLATATYGELKTNEYSLSYNSYVKEKWDISDDYKLVRLGDVCTIHYGTRITKKNNQGTLYPVYGGGGETFRTDTYNREGPTCKIGRFGVSKENCVMLLSKKYFLNDSGFTITSNDDTICISNYIWYHLLNMKQKIFKCVRGTAQGNIDISSFKSLQIPLPSLECQQEWVKRINRYRDMAIQAQKLIDLMETEAIDEVKKLMRHPESKLIKIGKIFKHVQRKTKIQDTIEYNEITLKLYFKGITHRGTIKGDLMKTKTRFVIKSGDFIYSKCDFRNKAFGIVSPEFDGAVVSSEFPTFTINDGFYLNFVCHMFHDESLIKYINEQSTGSTGGRIRLNVNSFNNIQIPIPPLRVQNQLKPLFDQISYLKANLKVWNDKVEKLIRELGEEAKKNDTDNLSDEESSDSSSDDSSDNTDSSDESSDSSDSSDKSTEEENDSNEPSVKKNTTDTSV